MLILFLPFSLILTIIKTLAGINHFSLLVDKIKNRRIDESRHTEPHLPTSAD